MDTENQNNPLSYGDQYTQYKNLPKLLKRFSFYEKMRICNEYSRKAMAFENSRDYDKLRSVPLPWCLETFTMLSIEAYEYSDGTFLGKAEKKFAKMMDAIWSHIPESLSNCGITFADYFLPVTALTQFYLQESYWIKFYRYWTIFSDNSNPTLLKDIFIKKMGTSYYDYLLFGICLKMFFSIKTPIPPVILDCLLYRFPQVSNHLIIKREDYISLQQKFISNPIEKSEYLYSVRPSYQYSFVKYRDSIYFPLPHLLTYNITSSLYFRMTDGDNNLRDHIGKHILERYLLNMMEQSNIYDEVFPEQLYKGQSGSEAKSPDVIARQKDAVLFLDSKSTVPSIGIRLFDSKAYEKNIEITTDNVIKLYKQIKNFSKFNPFAVAVSSAMTDYWGIVVVLEDSYIRRHKYYERVYNKLQLPKDSPEWQWIITHIKIVNLYEIERLCYCSCSIIDALKEQEKSGQIYDYPFSGTGGKDASFTNSNLLNFMTKVLCDVDAIKDELLNEGLLSR